MIGNCNKNKNNETVEVNGDQADVCVHILDVHSAEAVIYQNNTETTHQNVQFSDADAGYSYDLDDYVDPTRMMQDSDDVKLENFFSRPLKIAEYEWGNLTFFQSLNPWSVYFNNTRVKNRIANFHLLRCKLHVKVLINGTPFHYGRIMMGYNPLDTFDEVDSLTGLISQDLVQLSQRPKIFLNPTTSEGGDMELPFFWHKNYLSIPDEEWNDMGRLYLMSMNNLRQANGGTVPVTISIFAWATDVSLSVPTSVEPDTLQPQAKDQPMKNKGKSKTKMTAKAPVKTKIEAPEHQEANTKGMVSGPATAVAKAAGALKMIPMLAPYATAAEFAADKTAAIAKLFGYSRPAVTRDPDPFKPVTTSNLAVTTVPDMVNKLTVDDQQGLTIDTRIAGVGTEDTLAIKGIASRESYLTTFVWDTDKNPEQLLWNARVQPMLWSQSGSAGLRAHHFPACAMAAYPFKYWSGSMKFRFQIVKSQYHKGRIKVVYDPKFFASNEYNTNYLEVVDISEKDDFTITVGMAQTRTLLESLDPMVNSVTQGYSTTPYTSDNIGNGVLGIYVVNGLTAPTDAGNEIQVNVFVSMGDDFEVFVPTDKFMNWTPFEPLTAQSREQPLDVHSSEDEMHETHAAVGDEQGNKPLNTTEDETEVAMSLQYEQMLNRVWTGEKIESFRPLLRRYFLARSYAYADTSPTVIAGRFPSFPLYRGADPNGVDTATQGSYNFYNTGLIHWVTLAHQGWRGGIRYKFLARGEHDWATLHVSRSPIRSFANYNQTLSTPPSYTSATAAARSVMSTDIPSGNAVTVAQLGWNGVAYQTKEINPTLEFESPFYHPFRFYPGKVTDYVTSGNKTEGVDYRIIGKGSTNAAYDLYCSCAEDFQVYFWTGLPRMYFERAPAATS